MSVISVCTTQVIPSALVTMNHIAKADEKLFRFANSSNRLGRLLNSFFLCLFRLDLIFPFWKKDERSFGPSRHSRWLSLHQERSSSGRNVMYNKVCRKKTDSLVEVFGFGTEILRWSTNFAISQNNRSDEWSWTSGLSTEEANCTFLGFYDLSTVLPWVFSAKITPTALFAQICVQVAGYPGAVVGGNYNLPGNKARLSLSWHQCYFGGPQLWSTTQSSPRWVWEINTRRTAKASQSPQRHHLHSEWCHQSTNQRQKSIERRHQST